jgi:hypothetical protein
VVFSKTPVEGKVKTRLIPNWGTEGAMMLYKDLLKATLETVKASIVEDIYLYCTPEKDDSFIQFCARHFEIGLGIQVGADLGERMLNAFETLFRQYRKVIIVGCDCPGLSVGDIRIAVEKLSDGIEIVLGPSEDGGYYLLGMSRFEKGVFEGIAWGGPSVLEDTRKAISTLQLSKFELKEKWDVDRPEDVYRYFSHRESMR